MISHFGEQRGYIVQIFNQYLNTDKHIGVIHWWDIRNTINTKDLEKFVDGVDVCFVFCDEFLHIPGGIQRYLDVLDHDKVHFILSSEESEMPNNRCFNSLWFTQKTLHGRPTLSQDYMRKPYTFNMLLGSEKEHRTTLFNRLKDNNKVYSTYFGTPQGRSLSDTHLEDKDTLDNLKQQDLGKKLNTLEKVNGTTISHTIPAEIYDNSHFDIVSEMREDVMKNQILFATEKTAKPLATGRWFLSYAEHNMNTYLERYGFDFTDYLHDYDVEDNNYRLELIVQKVEEITKDSSLVKYIYSKTKANRIHNVQVYHRLCRNMAKDLIKFIGMVL
jgi:hypothetical protein